MQRLACKNQSNVRFPGQMLFSLVAVLMLGFSSVSTNSVKAQSPNTSSMIVVVVDQNGAVVKDAKVSVVNDATGAVRDVVTGCFQRLAVGVQRSQRGAEALEH